MKKLILTRHAKSDWGNLHLTDFDRPLNERGLHDAPMMGKRLLTHNISIDLIYSSTAMRASQTAIAIANAIQYPQENILWNKNLYHASPKTIEQHIEEIDDKYETVLLVAHNNGITEFVNNLCGFVTDNMPTCAMAGFFIDTHEWRAFSFAIKKRWFYDFPKNI